MDRRVNDWLNPLLYWLTVAMAVGLAALLVIAPWLDSGGATPDRGLLVLRLFAEDDALRRIALAVALGLIVTARIFFRKSTQ
jgi:hypothetical protein